MIGAIEVEGRIGCLWNGEGREGTECSVEVAFADFETDFWPVFDVVVFSLEETVEEFELSVYCVIFIKVALIVRFVGSHPQTRKNNGEGWTRGG